MGRALGAADLLCPARAQRCVVWDFLWISADWSGASRNCPTVAGDRFQYSCLLLAQTGLSDPARSLSALGHLRELSELRHMAPESWLAGLASAAPVQRCWPKLGVARRPTR